MAATAYSQLKDEFRRRLDRTDLEGEIDGFFEQAHRDINRRLRLPMMEAKAIYEVSPGWDGMILPGSFLE